jgi:hypothetical protein
MPPDCHILGSMRRAAPALAAIALMSAALLLAPAGASAYRLRMFHIPGRQHRLRPHLRQGSQGRGGALRHRRAFLEAAAEAALVRARLGLRHVDRRA